MKKIKDIKKGDIIYYANVYVNKTSSDGCFGENIKEISVVCFKLIPKFICNKKCINLEFYGSKTLLFPAAIICISSEILKRCLDKNIVYEYYEDNDHISFQGISTDKSILKNNRNYQKAINYVANSDEITIGDLFKKLY